MADGGAVAGRREAVSPQPLCPGEVLSLIHIFGTDAHRIVLLVRTVGKTEVSAYDVIVNLFPDKQKDFIFNISERCV